MHALGLVGQHPVAVSQVCRCALPPANEAAERWAEPALRRREALIESRLAEEVGAAVLEAYAGEYQMPEGWGSPDQTLVVIAGERSLELRSPDYRQHELFPESATDFFHVAFVHPAFKVDYQVRFGLDEERRVRYLELISGPESIRMERLGAGSFVPDVDTQEPAATAAPTAKPTATSAPTRTPAPTSIAATLSTTEVDEGADFSWAWPLALVLGVGAVVGWIAVRWAAARRR